MRRRALALASAAGLVVLATTAGGADKRKLAIEDLTAEPPVAGRSATGVTWVGGGARFSYVLRTGEGEDPPSQLWLEETATGSKRLVASSSALELPPEPASEGEPPATPPKTPRRASLTGHRWSPDGRSVLVSGANDLWLVDAGGGAASAGGRPGLTRLTRGADKEEFPSFSPDGRRVAFVRRNDLYVLELEGRRETRLTRDGSETIFNGKLDWVYEEELASRDGRGYEWSPDGRAIAYLRLDDGPVVRYPLVDFLEVPPAVEWQRYPKAGTPNPRPSFHVVTVRGSSRGAIRPEGDVYVVPGFSWTPDSRSVSYRILNRAQNRQEVNVLDAAGGGVSRTLFVESDPSWLNVVEPPRFLSGGRYVWKSERSGFAHLYVGRLSGGEPTPITRGDWVVDRVAGVDDARGLVYFTATEENVRRRPIYRVALDGGGFAKVTSTRGTHTGELSPDGNHLLDTFSTATQPPSLSLLRSSGETVRLVHRPETRLGEYELATTAEVEVRGDDGALLQARLVRPAGFDPSRKYPVVVYVYGGPHSQVVRDSWGATSLFDHLLASRGFLVWSLDNRGSFGRGRAWEAAVFRDMGRRELADQLAGVRYLKTRPFVDGSRIGIWGWSYGGYMTLFAMTNAPDVWKCGVAGAPVTHWKFYDTIYTERYMRTPAENRDGYEASSPLAKADALAAPLLLIHGAADDNVHLQNTLAFVDALTKAGKPYRLQVQPRQKHGFRGAESVNVRNRAIVGFFEEVMGSERD